MSVQGFAVVTGGGGRLGSLVSQRLLDAGIVDAVISLDVEHPDGSTDPRIQKADVDVTDRGAVRQAIGSAVPAGARVRSVVNCIGISPKSTDGAKVSIAEISTEDWTRVFEVNVLAPLIVLQELWALLADGEAAIVNVLSLIAKTGAGGLPGSRHGVPSPAGAHYGASKAALANLTLSLARELGPRGIRANAVSPGQIEGGMRGSVRSSDIDRMVEEIPLGRYAEYREIVDAIEYLASAKSSYISGEILDVNGGWYAD